MRRHSPQQELQRNTATAPYNEAWAHSGPGYPTPRECRDIGKHKFPFRQPQEAGDGAEPSPSQMARYCQSDPNLPAFLREMRALIRSVSSK